MCCIVEQRFVYLRYGKKRKIRTYGGYFEAFMETLTERNKIKFNMDYSC